MEISLAKAQSRIRLGLALASSLAGAAWAGTLTTGPLSPYYLDSSSSGTIYVVLGTSVVTSFPVAYGNANSEGALAVSNSTIYTRAAFSAGFLAGEYTLSGSPTGQDYTTPYSGSGRYFDGTSDGSHNYFVDHGADSPPPHGGVYEADLDWQNPHLIFYPAAACDALPPGCHGPSGIAYDPTNNSLWVSAKPNGEIGDYSMDGTLLAEFNAPNPFPGTSGPGWNSALGVDPADHTLWLTDGTNTLRQYSLAPATFGLLLQSGVPNGLPFATYESGEFNVVTPEPATFVLLLSFVAVIGSRIRQSPLFRINLL